LGVEVEVGKQILIMKGVVGRIVADVQPLR
jgi:hypothetical protein